MSTARMALSMLVGIGPAGAGWAAPAGDLAAENEALRRRVDRLEQELEALKALVHQQAAASGDSRAETGISAEDMQTLRALLQQLTAAPDAHGRRSVWSSLDVQLYGYVKLDAAYDTARVNPGNFARWVEPDTDDSQFNLTARETRLGLKLTGPATDELRTLGLIEVDFYGDGGENSPEPRMRHAYMQLEWPAHRLSLLAGQTWDVHGPLNMPTLNYSVGWWSGNIGFRRPQIRLTKQVAMTDDVTLCLEGAIARTLGERSPFDPGDIGEDAGFPTIEWRGALRFPLWGGRPTTIGVSGHYGTEEYDLNAFNTNRRLDSWSIVGDLAMPVTEWLTVKGEIFTGDNLDAYLGGIGQGIHPAGLGEIKGSGGWLALCLGPWERWQFNVGAAVDDARRKHLAGGSRDLNRSVFGNAIYAINEKASVGLELSHWHTDYKGATDGDALRLQTSFIYRF